MKARQQTWGCQDDVFTIKYTELTVTGEAVRVVNLNIDGTLAGHLVVSDTVIVVVQNEDTKYNITLDVGDTVRINVVDESGAAVKSTESVFLFEGRVNRTVAGIVPVMCARMWTFNALEETGASCVCWVRDVACSRGVFGNWCPDRIILGIKHGTLDFDVPRTTIEVSRVSSRPAVPTWKSPGPML